MSENNYLYIHKHPQTGEIVYVGKGSNSRAWEISTRRNPPHREWMSELTLGGCIPCDWVVITHRDLSSESASSLEKATINQYRPKFNTYNNPDASSVDQEEVARAKELRLAGMSFRRIAKQMGKGTQTIWRYCQ